MINAIYDNKLFRELSSLDLSADDYTVFGSGPMFAHGIKDLGHDLDVIARGSAWRQACSISSPQTAIWGGLVVNLFDGEIEIFDSWAPGDWDVNDLIDTSEIIDGIRFVILENVMKWKRLMGREKDQIHIKMIEDFLNRRSL